MRACWYLSRNKKKRHQCYIIYANEWLLSNFLRHSFDIVRRAATVHSEQKWGFLKSVAVCAFFLIRFAPLICLWVSWQECDINGRTITCKKRFGWDFFSFFFQKCFDRKKSWDFSHFQFQQLYLDCIYKRKKTKNRAKLNTAHLIS